MKEPSSVKDELEFWRWREYNRIVEGKEWKSKDIITAGVDVGSVGSKAAIMVNGEAYSWGSNPNRLQQSRERKQSFEHWRCRAQD